MAAESLADFSWAVQVSGIVRQQRKLAGLSESVWILLLTPIRHAPRLRRILLQGGRNGGVLGILVVSAIRRRLYPHLDCSFVGLARLLGGSGRPFRWHHSCACATETVSVTGPIGRDKYDPCPAIVSSW
jgi:hypothetical protein